MSSLLDAVIQSDNNAADQMSSRDASLDPSRRRLARPSSRPRGPPSVSTPGINSDIMGFADDEVVGVRGSRKGPRSQGPRPDVDRVSDTIGEHLVIEFERFLDEYVYVHSTGSFSRCSLTMLVDFAKTPTLRSFPLQALPLPTDTTLNKSRV